MFLTISNDFRYLETISNIFFFIYIKEMGRLKGKARLLAKEMNKLPEKRVTFDETKEPFMFKNDGEDVDEKDRKTAMEKAVKFVREKYFPDQKKHTLSDQDIECLIQFDIDNPNYVNRKLRGDDMTGEEEDMFSKAMKYFDYIKYENDQEIVGMDIINDPTPEMIAERFKEEGGEYLGGGQIKDASGNVIRSKDSIMTGTSSLPNQKADEIFKEKNPIIEGDDEDKPVIKEEDNSLCSLN